jgi:hypothetical protein
VNPLVRNGQQLTANVARVVSATQPMFFYFEVYDPANPGGAPPSTPGALPTPAPAQAARPAGASTAARVLSNVTCYRGTRRALQTGLVAFDQLNAVDRRAVTVELEVGPNQLPPGLYSCQVNIIDDAAGTFAFPRMALYVRR